MRREVDKREEDNGEGKEESEERRGEQDWEGEYNE